MAEAFKPEDSMDVVYEVEAILDTRHATHGTEYLVKWKQYDENNNSWVKEGDLDCPELLAQFAKTRYENMMLDQAEATEPSSSVRKRKRPAKRAKLSHDGEPFRAVDSNSGKSVKDKRQAHDSSLPKAPSDHAPPILTKTKGKYAYETYMIQDEVLIEVQKRNKELIKESAEALATVDFWRTLEEYNYDVRTPVHPGTNFFIMELGPIISTKARITESCHGCGADIDVGEYSFWHPREVAFVDHHFCQLCVCYVLYHLQVLKEKPDQSAAIAEMLHQALLAKYPAYYAKSFPRIRSELITLTPNRI